MKETLSKKETPIIIGAGVIIGIIAVALVYFGNPANMGFCIACFLRDTSGALGFHSAAAVQYIRPEIVGLVLGSCILALATKEFKPRGGSAPVTRFVIGMFVMIGCLMFLGCPFRMILRLAGGDFNAIFGLIGFIAGILAGVFFLKKGYTLKRSYKMQPVEGGIFPVVEIGILLLLIAAPAFIHFTEADGGPGAKHAAIAISLIAGLLVGALAQRTRLCMVGGIRDVVLFGCFFHQAHTFGIPFFHPFAIKLIGQFLNLFHCISPFIYSLFFILCTKSRHIFRYSKAKRKNIFIYLRKTC